MLVCLAAIQTESFPAACPNQSLALEGRSRACATSPVCSRPESRCVQLPVRDLSLTLTRSPSATAGLDSFSSPQTGIGQHASDDLGLPDVPPSRPSPDAPLVVQGRCTRALPSERPQPRPRPAAAAACRQRRPGEWPRRLFSPCPVRFLWHRLDQAWLANGAPPGRINRLSTSVSFPGLCFLPTGIPCLSALSTGLANPPAYTLSEGVCPAVAKDRRVADTKPQGRADKELEGDQRSLPVQEVTAACRSVGSERNHLYSAPLSLIAARSAILPLSPCESRRR